MESDPDYFPIAMTRTISINRAPVLTLWAAVVAERLGFEWEEALTLGRAVAGLNAYSKGVRLGLFTPSPPEVREKRKALRPKETITVDLLSRAVPAVHTKQGLRALAKEKAVDPESVERYLFGKFGDGYDDALGAMQALAKSRPPAKLAAEGFHLYEQFRPSVPAGTRGWEAKGKLDLDAIRSLAK
jgi:hypothetical protein